MSELPNVQENNEQILNDIQELQHMEQQLFYNLETNPNLDINEKKQIISKMNQLSNMRVNLYQTLSGVNNYFKNALNTSVGSLKQQLTAIDIVEKELTKSKKRLEILEEEKNNKIRLVEINSYFSDKYAEHAQLMKIVIYTLIPIIILAVLNNIGIIPNTFYYILLIIIFCIGAYYFGERIISIWMRDNMNYQTYDWNFNPNDLSNDTSSNITDPWGDGIDLTTCIGNNCCSSGLVYNSKLNKCVTGKTTSKTTKKEGFITDLMINDVLTKKEVGNYKDVVNLREPKPFNN